MSVYVHHSLAAEILNPSQIIVDQIQPTSMMELGAPSNYFLRRFQCYFKGAVYVDNDFGTINLGGLIDGKDSSYSLQTGDAVPSAPLHWNIIFKGPVIQRKKRDDYRSIWNKLKDEYRVIKVIVNNDNANIVEHNISNSRQWLDLGSAKYYFNMNNSGEIVTATLIVKKNKTYTLPSGNYFLKKLELEEGAQLNVSGPVTIFLYSTQGSDYLRLEEDASINKNGNPGDFSLLGFNKYVYNRPSPMIEMFKGSQLNGTILAPYYLFIIREGARLEGALLVHNFMMWMKTEPIPPRWEIIYAGPFFLPDITVALDGRGDFTSIQAAIYSARNGDVIIVHPGIYYENIDLLGKAITVKSIDPNDPNVVATTIIDGNNAGSDYVLSDFTMKTGSVVTFNYQEGPNSVLSGFTVQNGKTSLEGGGIFCYGSSPVISNCTISHNSAAGDGGGIFCYGSSPVISNCTISHNSAAGDGGGISCNHSSPSISNCTISHNSAVSDAGGIFCYGSSPRINNCIFWADSPNEIGFTNNTLTITYSNIQGGYAGEGNIDTDPLFIDPNEENFHLFPLSFCIDAGDPNSTINEDKNGVPRPQDGDCDGIAICDMGAYEYRVTNCPPILNPIGNKEVDEGVLQQFTVTASDPYEHELNYSASNLPTGANFIPDTQVFNWTPSFTQAGSYEIIFIVTDNGTPLLSDEETINITVQNVNRSPALTAIGNKNVNEGWLLQFSINAIDPDGDVLTYFVHNLPSGASFDPNTQEFSWKPNYNQAGSYEITFAVTDNGTPSLGNEEIITINVENVNRRPELVAIGNRTIGEGRLLQFTISASDPDGDDLIYSASNLSTGASFDPNTQKFSWKPNYKQAGNYEVTFMVTDNDTSPLTDSEAIIIEVLNKRRPSSYGSYYGYGWYAGWYSKGYLNWELTDYQQQLWNNQLLANWNQPALQQWPILSKTWQQQIWLKPFALQAYMISMPSISQLQPWFQQQYQQWDFTGYQQQVFEFQKQQQLLNLQQKPWNQMFQPSSTWP